MRTRNEQGALTAPEPISPDDVARAMRRASRLRSLHVAMTARRAWRALRRLMGFSGGATRAHSQRDALASLRSSAEILRDHPDIDPAQRRRLIDIVLAEEARLEKLLKVGGGPALSG